MSPIAEKTLAPETATGILEDAENLAEDKLSALESFLESLNLPDSLASLGDGALALAASFLAALGFDLDFDTPLKPAEAQHVSVEIGHCDVPAAPANERVEDVGEMGAVLEDRLPPEDLTDDKGWDDYLDWLYQALLPLDCPQLQAMADQQSNLLLKLKGDVYNIKTYRVEQILGVVLEVMKENNCLH